MLPVETRPTMRRMRADRAWWLGVGAIAALTLLVQLELTVRRPDRSLFTFDSAEFAVAGRELSRSGRLGTTFVLPDELSVPRRPPFPLQVGHPVVPMLDAARFALAGERPELTLIPPALAYLALVILTGLLVRRLGGSTVAAGLAGLTVALSERILYYSTEGLSEIPFAACGVAAMLALGRLPRGGSPWLLGALLGLGHLTRPVMVALLPAWIGGAAAAAEPGRRIRTAALAFAGFVPFAASLALYKWVAAGDPLADVSRYNLLIGLAPEFDPIRIHRMLDLPPPGPFLASHAAAVFAKLAAHGPGMLGGALNLAGPLAPLLLIGFLLMPERSRGDRALAFTAVAILALLVLVVTLTLPTRRYLAPLLPLLAAFGIAGAARLADRGRRGLRTLALVLMIAIAAPAAYVTARTWRWAFPAGYRDRGVFTESQWRALGRAVSTSLPRGAIVASDAGAFVAWYGDRATVLIPDRPEDLEELDRRLPLDALVLTNEWLVEQPGHDAWRAILEGASLPSGWVAAGETRSGSLYARILRRSRGP